MPEGIGFVTNNYLEEYSKNVYFRPGKYIKTPCSVRVELHSYSGYGTLFI